ncbi:MAG: YncE family protein [Nitrospinae bacterium]|nr:YncE family protein [Nitrospinota bacterium]
MYPAHQGGENVGKDLWEEPMRHWREQNESMKHATIRARSSRFGWGARLALLGLIAALGLLTLGTAPVQAAPLAYITNRDSNTVSIIDTVTNTVVTSVAVGAEPGGVAVHPAGTRVYVKNEGSHSVSVIDTATHTVVATVPVGSPGGVAVHPAGTRVYAVSAGVSDSVSVIDTTSNTVVATVPVGAGPVGVAVHPAGARQQYRGRHRAGGDGP